MTSSWYMCICILSDVSTKRIKSSASCPADIFTLSIISNGTIPCCIQVSNYAAVRNEFVPHQNTQTMPDVSPFQAYTHDNISDVWMQLLSTDIKALPVRYYNHARSDISWRFTYIRMFDECIYTSKHTCLMWSQSSKVWSYFVYHRWLSLVVYVRFICYNHESNEMKTLSVGS